MSAPSDDVNKRADNWFASFSVTPHTEFRVMKVTLALVFAALVAASMATVFFEDDFSKDGTAHVSCSLFSSLESFLGLASSALFLPHFFGFSSHVQDGRSAGLFLTGRRATALRAPGASLLAPTTLTSLSSRVRPQNAWILL